MQRECFELLPLGAVHAKGYLKEQLELQSANFTGKMEEYPDYCQNSAWLGGDGESWERGPYYMRGLVALAYCLRDKQLIERARKWMNYPLEHQDEDGNFYPLFDYCGDDAEILQRKEICKNEWWAKMPVLMALRDYYEAEKLLGNEDKRVLPFFRRYFAYQYRTLSDNPLSEWAEARGGDNVEIVLWFYKIVGEEWLIDLSKLILSQTTDWTDVFGNTCVRHHVVNTMQAVKTPILSYLLMGEKTHIDALYLGIEAIRRDHGRIDFLPNADEAARDNEFYHGTETCAVAEGMLSMEIAGRATGDRTFFDLLENYAYNSLPNCYWYDMTRYCYFQVQNQVLATVGYHGFSNDHGDSCAFGVPDGFDCCFANGHMAWPKFVQNLWAKTDDGIAAVVYGPSSVEIVHQGKRIIFDEETDYPFDECIHLIYKGEPCAFSLRLRVPGWSKGHFLFVNNEKVNADNIDGWIEITRAFRYRDEISLRFKAEAEVNHWHHDAVYIKRGGLLYCLPIKEKAEEIDADEYREIAFHSPVKTLCVYPDETWAFALDTRNIQYIKHNNKVSFTPIEPPCEIKVLMRRDEDWLLHGNMVSMHDDTRLVFDEENMVEKRLIPYGCSRLKISLFPEVFHISDLEPSLDLRATIHGDVLTVDYPIPTDTDAWLLRINQTYYLPHRNTYAMARKPFYTRDQYSVTVKGEMPIEVQAYYFKSGEMVSLTRPYTVGNL